MEKYTEHKNKWRNLTTPFLFSGKWCVGEWKLVSLKRNKIIFYGETLVRRFHNQFESWQNIFISNANNKGADLPENPSSPINVFVSSPEPSGSLVSV